MVLTEAVASAFDDMSVQTTAGGRGFRYFVKCNLTGDSLVIAILAAGFVGE